MSQRKSGTRWLPLSIALAVFAAAPLLLGPGFLNTRAGGDSPFLLFRLHQLHTALSEGIFPVRWMPDAAFGFGYPFFSYYAALPYYLAAGFKTLGFSYVTSLKLAQLTGFLLAGGAMYAWIRRHMPGEWSAMLASAAYTFAPFHMTNVYVRGDSLAEFFAFVFYPLTLWTADRLFARKTPARVAWLALAYAGLLLTHNISAFIFSPFLGLYLLLLGGKAYFFGASSLVHKSKKLLAAYAIYAAAILTGVLAAAGFWLPAVGELDAVQLEDSTTGYFHYSNHFLGGEAIQNTFVFNYEVDTDSTPFTIGGTQAVFLAGGLLAMWASRRSGRAASGTFILFLLLGGSLALFLITPASRFLWDTLPLLPVVQFPWRFLSIFSIFSASLTGYIAAVWGHKHNKYEKQSWPSGIIALTLSAVLAASALIGLHPEFILLNDHDITPETLQLYEYFSGNIGTTIRYEWLPRTVNPRPYTGPEFLNQELRPKALNGDVQGMRHVKEAASQQWIISVTSETATVALPLYYWPGWQAQTGTDRLELSAEPGLGWVRFTLPYGTHTVKLWLDRTPLRAAAEWLSVLGLLLVLTLLWRRMRKRMFELATAVVLSALLALALGLLTLPASEPLTGPLTMDFARAAYPHHASDGVPFEGAITLLEYVYNFAGTDCLELTLAATWSSPTEIATMTPRLTLPATNVLDIPITLAKGETVPVSSTAETDLTLPCPTSPGVYLLSLETAFRDEPLYALTANGDRRGTLFLAPIAHHARNLTDSPGEPLGVFGDELSLLGATLQPGNPNLKLRWRIEQRATRNYHIGLRLYDVVGNLWTEQDAPLGLYGAYPPALWAPRETVHEAYALPIPEGMPPGTYTLHLNVYDAATGESTGALALEALEWRGHSPAPAGSPRLFAPLPSLSITGLEVPDTVTAGRPFPLTIRWIVEDNLYLGHRVHWSLGDVWSTETPLAPGSKPARWQPGALVEGRLTLEPPADITPGTYPLTLTLIGPDGAAHHEPFTAVPGLEVKPLSVPTGTPDDLPNWVNVDFGGDVRLWGYDMARQANDVILTLTWGALDKISSDYRFFVHLFDPATEIIPTQIDTMPHAYTYPTSMWAPGEIVTDTVTLDLAGVPPGEYRLAIGWYDETDRLAAHDAAGDRLEGDRVVLPPTITVP